MPITITDEQNMLLRRIERMQKRLDLLASLPDEPEADLTSEALIIYFEKTFGTSTMFNYAAIKAGNGRWYVTGARSPQQLTWAELVSWVNQDEPGPVDLYQVTAIEVL